MSKDIQLVSGEQYISQNSLLKDKGDHTIHIRKTTSQLRVESTQSPPGDLSRVPPATLLVTAESCILPSEPPLKQFHLLGLCSVEILIPVCKDAYEKSDTATLFIIVKT